MTTDARSAAGVALASEYSVLFTTGLTTAVASAPAVVTAAAASTAQGAQVVVSLAAAA